MLCVYSQKKLMKLFITLTIVVFLGSCAKNSRDVVEEGRTIGVFEPKRDYVVDVPMGEQRVMGKANGMKILGLITIGAGKTADGVDINNRGESTMDGGVMSSAGATSFASMALAPLAAIGSTSDQFKKAALRDACDKNKCDVLGYTMYDVTEKNYFLFKTYDVKVEGFPGRVGKLENVQRKYKVRDSYWRRPLPEARSY